MEEIIDNDFKGDKEINEADNVCAKVDAEMKNKIKKILIDINKKSTENQRKIIDVEAQISEMTSGNDNCRQNHFPVESEASKEQLSRQYQWQEG